MAIRDLLERFYIYCLMIIIKPLADKGGYRLALKLYPLNSSFFRRINFKKKYLDKKYELSIFLNSTDLIDHKILFTGVYERGTNRILIKYLKEGDIVVEAGANTGSETLLISRLVGSTGRVLAFEPVPHVIKKLKQNIKLNKITNIDLHEIALGEKDQLISFHINSKDHPNQGMGTKLNIDFEQGEKISVIQKTLDSVLETNYLNENIAFIKMDIQGAEFDMLNGASKVIKKFNPTIFFEASEGWSNLKNIYHLLISFNYTVFKVDENDASLIKLDINRLINGNWLAIHDSNQLARKFLP